MEPTLAPGDVVCVDRRVGPDLPPLGRLVAVRDPRRPERTLVKRVRSHGTATFAVGSDAPAAGTDSRTFGSLGKEHLIGVVLWAWSRERGMRDLRAPRP